MSETGGNPRDGIRRHFLGAAIIAVGVSLTGVAVVFVADTYMKRFVGDATVEFMAARKVQQQATESLIAARMEANRIRGEIEESKKSFYTDLKSAEDDLRNMRLAINDLLGPRATERQEGEPPIAIDFKGMEAGIENSLREVDELRKSLVVVADLEERVAVLEKLHELAPSTLTKQEPFSLGDGDRNRIEGAIRVRQDTKKIVTKSDDRNWYKLTYRIEIEPNTYMVKGKKIIDLINRVVYNFDERWYSNPFKTSVNRKNGFKMSVNVWGITNVKIKIHVRGLGTPIDRERLMSLHDSVTF